MFHLSQTIRIASILKRYIYEIAIFSCWYFSKLEPFTISCIHYPLRLDAIDELIFFLLSTQNRRP